MKTEVATATTTNSAAVARTARARGRRPRTRGRIGSDCRSDSARCCSERNAARMRTWSRSSLSVISELLPKASQAGLQVTFGCVLADAHRSEEHTSELQSRQYLVCRLLLEKKT